MQKALKFADDASGLFDTAMDKLKKSTALLDQHADAALAVVYDLEHKIEVEKAKVESAVAEKIRNSRLLDKLEEFIR